tara:strand:- start:15 stop:233 length:219 start_codon:yes stop_codon:yes gene_type:complete
MMTPIGEKSIRVIPPVGMSWIFLRMDHIVLPRSWMMGALHNKWKKMKGYKDPEPPDCSSSLQEWEQSIKKYQ